ncbi:MAG: aspartate kinase [Clostridia bacterium]
MIKVCKFGGSSLADAKQFAKVKAIVDSDNTRRIVVVSAPGRRSHDDNKITDLLYLCQAHLKYGVSYDGVFGMVEERFRTIAQECGVSYDIEAELTDIRKHMNKDVSIDYLASRGEYLSARLMAEYLGFTFFDSAQWMHFGYDGKLDAEATYAALLEGLQKYGSLVLPGFYGSLPNGDIHVMSRGGSDITGALAAAAIDASVYENWTDVSGILMADPRIVDNPKPIERITYSELRELSYMGAEVLHEETVFPVRDKDIPLNIRNTNDPNAPGTLIKESFEDESEQERNRFITGISGRKDFSIIAIYKSQMAGESGVIRRVLEIFERYGVGIEHIPSGIDSFSVVVSTAQVKRRLYDIIEEIRKSLNPDDIRVTDNISLIAAVGRKMALRPGMSGKLFATLGSNDINIRMIAQGPEEINIIVGVENHDFEKTIRVLYDSFMR